MIHLDVKKTGRIPDGGGWRVHGKGSDRDRLIARGKNPRPAGPLHLPALRHENVADVYCVPRSE